jgi:hypothetical protein
VNRIGCVLQLCVMCKEISLKIAWFCEIVGSLKAMGDAGFSEFPLFTESGDFLRGNGVSRKFRKGQFCREFNGLQFLSCGNFPEMSFFWGKFEFFLNR